MYRKREKQIYLHLCSEVYMNNINCTLDINVVTRIIMSLKEPEHTPADLGIVKLTI